VFYVATSFNMNQLSCRVIFVMQRRVKFLISCCYEKQCF